ncbi:MAG TPA: metallophosphoesterase family protein [Anaerolineae bacterium]
MSAKLAMRVLVVSDIHSNLAALDAVINAAGQFDRVWCLGDVVGYGPSPNECIERLREFDLICVAGNHDLGVTGQVGLWEFGQDAKEVIFWTRHSLTLSNRSFLESLPAVLVQVDEPISLAHASPRDPVWEYVFSPVIARECFSVMQRQICLVGHTHIPILFRKTNDSMGVAVHRLPLNAPMALVPDKMIINPGSVGQPRDEDPRAAYAIIDLEAMSLTYDRVKYDVGLTQDLMKKAKLPERLIRRLRHGE